MLKNINCKACTSKQSSIRDTLKPEIPIKKLTYQCFLCGWDYCESHMSQIDSEDKEDDICVVCDLEECR